MLGIKDTNVDVWEIREELGSFVIELFTNVRKQKLDQWFKESDESTAKQGLEVCMQAMNESNIDAFHRVTKTFQRWKTEIFQSFMHPFNNGYIEGINNTIKVLKRDSFGVKRFERLRSKILWQQGVKRAF
ncbi:transposase [Alkalibacillus silvisoli]|uniref:Transposase IS204/IS1001/IS1096/IS1165 DDE domain-containing protein n=1 Tax=Alkalibacillus silvisoli TaxID=392823 RepID=A0ABP3K6G0_9BACI